MARILIVDDDTDFLEACENILKNAGYDTVKANTISGAESAIREGGLDLILLDIMLENPDDGISLAHKLKKEGVKIPVVMLSGASRVTGYKYDCDEILPCAGFIEKPVSPSALLEKVKSVIKK